MRSSRNSDSRTLWMQRFHKARLCLPAWPPGREAQEVWDPGAADVLEELLEQAIPCVRPNPLFRRSLRKALLAHHRQRAVQRSLFPNLDRTPPLWNWQMAATVPVVIGIIALLWRRLHRPTAPTAEIGNA